MNRLAAICCCLLLAACAPQLNGKQETDQPTPVTPFDQQLFVDGIDQLIRQEKPESLIELKNNFPGSPWTKQAIAILDLSEQLHRQQQQLAQLEKTLAKPTRDKSLDLTEEQLKQCVAEQQNLQQELDTLNERLEALRELTIELELK